MSLTESFLEARRERESRRRPRRNRPEAAPPPAAWQAAAGLEEAPPARRLGQADGDWGPTLEAYNPGYTEDDAARAEASLEGIRRQRRQTFGEVPVLNALGWHGIADIDPGASNWGMADNVISTLGEAGSLGADTIMSGIDAIPGVDASNAEREQRWDERGQVANRVGEFFGDVGGALDHAAMNPVSEWGDDVAQSVQGFSQGIGEATRGRTPLQVADDFLWSGLARGRQETQRGVGEARSLEGYARRLGDNETADIYQREATDQGALNSLYVAGGALEATPLGISGPLAGVGRRITARNIMRMAGQEIPLALRPQATDLARAIERASVSGDTLHAAELAANFERRFPSQAASYWARQAEGFARDAPNAAMQATPELPALTQGAAARNAADALALTNPASAAGARVRNAAIGAPAGALIADAALDGGDMGDGAQMLGGALIGGRDLVGPVVAGASRRIGQRILDERNASRATRLADDAPMEFEGAPQAGRVIDAEATPAPAPDEYGRQVRIGEQVNADGSVAPRTPIDWDNQNTRLPADDEWFANLSGTQAPPRMNIVPDGGVSGRSADDMLRSGPDAGRARGGRRSPYQEELRAQGFDVESPLYRGMTRQAEGGDFTRNADLQGSEQFNGTSFSRSPSEANLYAMEGDGGVMYPAYMRGLLESGPDYMRAVQARAREAGITNQEAARQVQQEYAQRGVTGVEWPPDRYGKGGEVRIFDPSNTTSSLGANAARATPDGGSARGRPRRLGDNDAAAIAGVATTGAAGAYTADQLFNQEANASDGTDTGGNPIVPILGAGVTLAGLEALRRGRLGQSSRSQVGMFAGVNARTADRAALARAEELAASGASRDAIWQETGWFQGVDGKWRFEIDDSGAQIAPDMLERHSRASVGGSQRRPLSEGLQHPELNDAYDLSDTTLDFGRLSRGAVGEYDNSRRSISMYAADDPDMLRSGTLHETQHRVQREEGFATGGTPESAWGVNEQASLDAIRAQKKEALGGRDPYAIQNRIAAGYRVADEDMAALEQWRALTRQEDEILANTLSPREAYRRLGGETEARNVQTRRDFTPEERRARAPWETQDVPDDQQIVRFDGGRAESRPEGNGALPPRRLGSRFDSSVNPERGPVSEAQTGTAGEAQRLTEEQRAALSPDQSYVLERRLAGARNAEIADEMQTSANAVAVQYHNAQRRLAQAGFDLEVPAGVRSGRPSDGLTERVAELRNQGLDAAAIRERLGLTEEQYRSRLSILSNRKTEQARLAEGSNSTDPLAGVNLDANTTRNVRETLREPSEYARAAHQRVLETFEQLAAENGGQLPHNFRNAMAERTGYQTSTIGQILKQLRDGVYGEESAARAAAVGAAPSPREPVNRAFISAIMSSNPELGPAEILDRLNAHRTNRGMEPTGITTVRSTMTQVRRAARSGDALDAIAPIGITGAGAGLLWADQAQAQEGGEVLSDGRAIEPLSADMRRGNWRALDEPYEVFLEDGSRGRAQIFANMAPDASYETMTVISRDIGAGQFDIIGSVRPAATGEDYSDTLEALRQQNESDAFMALDSRSPRTREEWESQWSNVTGVPAMPPLDQFRSGDRQRRDDLRETQRVTDPLRRVGASIVTGLVARQALRHTPVRGLAGDLTAGGIAAGTDRGLRALSGESLEGDVAFAEALAPFASVAPTSTLIRRGAAEMAIARPRLSLAQAQRSSPSMSGAILRESEDFLARREAFRETLSNEQPRRIGQRTESYQAEVPLDSGRRLSVSDSEAATQGYRTMDEPGRSSDLQSFDELTEAEQLAWMDSTNFPRIEGEAAIRERDWLDDVSNWASGDRVQRQRRLPAPGGRPAFEEPVGGFYDPATGEPLFGNGGRRPPPRRERLPIDQLRNPASRIGKTPAERVDVAREIGVVNPDESVSGAEATRRIMAWGNQSAANMQALRARFPVIFGILFGGAVASGVATSEDPLANVN